MIKKILLKYYLTLATVRYHGQIIFKNFLDVRLLSSYKGKPLKVWLTSTTILQTQEMSDRELHRQAMNIKIKVYPIQWWPFLASNHEWSQEMNSNSNIKQSLLFQNMNLY